LFVELELDRLGQLVQSLASQTSAAVEQPLLAEVAEQQRMVVAVCHNGLEQSVHCEVQAVTMDGAVGVDAVTVSFLHQQQVFLSFSNSHWIEEAIESIGGTMLVAKLIAVAAAAAAVTEKHEVMWCHSCCVVWHTPFSRHHLVVPLLLLLSPSLASVRVSQSSHTHEVVFPHKNRVCQAWHKWNPWYDPQNQKFQYSMVVIRKMRNGDLSSSELWVLQLLLSW
jgi:hypothetical protein